MVDYWLLERFPGRTLEELDAMDWGRYMKAIEAGTMQEIEKVRDSQIRGEIAPDKIDKSTWASIMEHDELMRSSDGRQ